MFSPITILAAAAASLLVSPSPAERPEIYILAGQSNMSGRGSLTDLTDNERTSDPSIVMLGNDGVVRPASEPLDNAERQIDPVSADRQAAVGPGSFFARALLETRGRPILLVPCAKGGSSIERWAAGGGRETLYGSCIERARALGPVTGILWYQGETDAEALHTAERWGERFEELVANLRRDLGAPALPIVFVQLADQPVRGNRAARFPGWRIVQQEQASVAVPCTRMVPASGLEQNDDELHLATAGQRRLGRRLAVAMTKLLEQDCC